MGLREAANRDSAYLQHGMQVVETKAERYLDATHDGGLYVVEGDLEADDVDGWEHTINVERIEAAVPGQLYPRLIEATGRCPPEDIGGPPGYAEFLEAIADPGHERHDELIEWYDADFDPNTVNAEAIEQQIANLAKRWSRSKSKRPRKAA